jgi:hypothetical protein
VGGKYDDRDGETRRDGGCGPGIDAQLTVTVKDISVLGSMLFFPHRLHRTAGRVVEEGGEGRGS